MMMADDDNDEHCAEEKFKTSMIQLEESWKLAGASLPKVVVNYFGHQQDNEQSKQNVEVKMIRLPPKHVWTE